MKVGFLITCYDQKREAKFTHHMLRNLWKRTADSPIVIVISGDPERTVKFPDDKLTRVVSLDDIVGNNFNGLVSTSIAKQIMHGIIELEDLQRISGKIDVLVHFHGDVIFLNNEEGFFQELEKFNYSGKNVGADTVGAQKSDFIEFTGNELMPQVFVTRMNFIQNTGFLKTLTVEGELEKKSTEWMLKGNLIRCAGNVEDNLYEVIRHRSSQWDIHKSYGGWMHWGNSIHFSKEQREKREEATLKAFNLSLDIV